MLTVNANCLNPGQTLTVQITATIAATAPSGLTIPNSATMTYTSLPVAGTSPNPTGSVTPGAGGTDTGERTGSVRPAPNDYTATSPVNVTLAVPAVTKTGHADHYTIGDHITYNIRVTLREGVTRGLLVADLLPSRHSNTSPAASRSSPVQPPVAGFSPTISMAPSIPRPPSWRRVEAVGYHPDFGDTTTTDQQPQR